MSIKFLSLAIFIFTIQIGFAQSLELNGGIMNSIDELFEEFNFNKSLDNFVDVRYTELRKGKKRSYFSLGLINRSDNFNLEAFTGDIEIYPKKTIEYKNRLTILYGGLRWQFPLFNSKLSFANQINFGMNFYRMEVKQYLHPQDNDYMKTGTGPYLLIVSHDSHLKLNIRYEWLFIYPISPKISMNFNASVQFLQNTSYEFTRSTSSYGDYFEKYFTSPEFGLSKSVVNSIYQLGIGIQYNLSKNEK